VSTHKGRGGLHLQQKINFKTIYKILKKSISTPSFQQQQQIFISANEILPYHAPPYQQ
jgi:hypothetical protein